MRKQERFPKFLNVTIITFLIVGGIIIMGYALESIGDEYWKPYDDFCKEKGYEGRLEGFGEICYKIINDTLHTREIIKINGEIYFTNIDERGSREKE